MGFFSLQKLQNPCYYDLTQLLDSIEDKQLNGNLEDDVETEK